MSELYTQIFQKIIFFSSLVKLIEQLNFKPEPENVRGNRRVSVEEESLKQQKHSRMSPNQKYPNETVSDESLSNGAGQSKNF